VQFVALKSRGEAVVLRQIEIDDRKRALRAKVKNSSTWNVAPEPEVGGIRAAERHVNEGHHMAKSNRSHSTAGSVSARFRPPSPSWRRC
jgi:hypothetical protein